LYIRNAVEDPYSKPDGGELEWSDEVMDEIGELSLLLDTHCPQFLLSFGAFSFEFARRALKEMPISKHSQWGAKNLGEAFRNRISYFDPKSVNLLPLLHVSIARGRFIQSHDYFTDVKGGNYFQHAAELISDAMITHSNNLDIWVERSPA
jgi:hypothetical protein